MYKLISAIKPPETDNKADDRVLKFLETLDKSTSTINTNVAKLLDLPTDKPVLDSAALDLLKSLDTTSTSIDKSIAKLLKAFNDFSFGDQIINNEKGTSIWDVFNRLVDFIDNFTDTLMNAFIPEDVSFIEHGFSDLRDTINGKFEGIDVFQVFIKSALDVEQKELPNEYTVDFRGRWGLGNVKIMDLTQLNEFLPIFRNLVSAFLYFGTAVWAYKKLTNNTIN